MSEYVGSENDFVLTKELDLNSNLLQHTPAHTNPIPKKKSMNSNRVGIEYVRWTKEEEEKLIHLVEVTGGRNWVEIGRLMNNERTAKACNHKYQDLTKSSMQHSQNSLLMNIDGNMLNHEILQGMIQNTIENDSNNNNAGNDADNGCTGNEGDLEEKSKKNSTIRTSQGHNRILWSAEEDKMLLEFISENANAVHIPWSKLAIPGRSRKACSNRWDYQLKCKFMRQEEFQPVSLPRPSQQAQVQSQQSPQVPETGESIPLGNQIVMEKNVSDDVNLVGKIGSDHAGMEDGIANNKRSDLNTMNNRMENNGDTMQQNQNNSAAAMSSNDAESVNMLTSGKINNQILNAEGNTHCSNALNPVHHSNPDGNIDEHTTRNSNTNNELSTMVMDSYRDASQSHNMVHMSHMDGLAQYSDTNHHHNSDMGCNNDINHLQQKHQQGDLGQISNFNHTEMSNQHQMMHDNDDFDNDANMPNNHLKRSKKSAKSNTGAISSKDSVASGDNQRWTAEEDASLYEYVQMHGFQNIPWAKVNKIVPNRSTIACRKRWSNYLKRKHEDAHSTHSGPVFGHHMHSSQSNPLHAMFGDRQNRMDTGVSMYPQIVQNTNHMNADANAPVMESYVSNEEPIEYIENKRSRSEMENDSTEQIEAMDSHGHIENPNPNPNEQGNGQCMNNTSVNRLDDTAYESNLNQTSVPLGMYIQCIQTLLLHNY